MSRRPEHAYEQCQIVGVRYSINTTFPPDGPRGDELHSVHLDLAVPFLDEGRFDKT